ncbi:MAG: FIST C-terminal domain-containing protein [Saprospiraceae bacterium]|nr:FIST C-terminal domain-containing protein [Saprospiraceae bacterium]
MKAKSIKGSSPAEIRTALSTSLADGFKPSLALVFISIKQNRKQVIDALSDKGIDIIGATSSGEFINGHQSEGEIVVLLMDIQREHYCILFEDIGDRNQEDATSQLVQRAFNKFDKPAFILITTLLTSDGKFLDGEGLISCIERQAGPDISMFGGMAGDDITFTGTWIFTQDQSTDYGMAALVLDEAKVELHGLALSGWKPMGVFRRATKSEGNLLYTIDDRPALEMYLQYLGHKEAVLEDQIEFFETIGIHYPFQIERIDREPKMCSPIGYDKENKALVCESDVPQGSRLRFSTPPDFDIIETVMNKASEIKKMQDSAADALLIFSCAGRLNALGPMAQQENEGLFKVWNAPMAGFYTYGEFGKGENGKHEFHSTTCSWVALKEKSQ